MAGENGPLGGVMDRDEWSLFPMAANALAASIMANYPQSGMTQYVNQQYEISRANHAAMVEKEAQRQAAKEANRNRNLGLAGMALGGVTGGLAAPAMGVTTLSGVVGGAGFGGNMATGNYAGAASALGALTPKPTLPPGMTEEEYAMAIGQL